MVRALIFLGFVSGGFSLALLRGPFWGLESYAFIYFVPPDPQISWWAKFIPFEARWSLLATAVMAGSAFLYRGQLARRNLSSARWVFAFLILTAAVTFLASDNQPDAVRYLTQLTSYSIGVWFIIRIIRNLDQFRFFLFSLILGGGYLSLLAYLEGERVHARLENIGTADTMGSNEFGLLLGGIMPLMGAFLVYGKWYEKLVCVLIAPFALNAFILCNSRGAAVALALSVFYAGVFIANMKTKKILLGAVILSIPLFIYVTDVQFLKRITTLWKADEALQEEKAINKLSSGRIEIWKYGVNMVNDHPFGAGPNSFKHLARFYMPTEVLVFHSGDEYGVRAAHNTYLQVLVEQGYLGLLLWLIMCLHVVYVLKKSAVKLNRLNLSGSFLGLSVLALNISFLCSLLGGIFNSRIYYEFFWWQIALSVVAFSLVNEVANKELEEKETEPAEIT